jgi:tartrate/fumarate subfamily iron-sulfur-dependent hydro-lyase beta chain
MKEILATLSQYPIKTRVSMTGTMIVARDSAHAKLRERLEKGEPLPDYFKNHPVYYAGPAKTPDGYASGAFGPTTAGRMDSFVDQFQAAGGSMVMVAKGNRAVAVREACKKYGGFYLGSIGGAAANLAEHCIKKVEVVEYPELGMEAIWRIEVEDFPGLHHRRRQGQRLLQGIESGVRARSQPAVAVIAAGFQAIARACRRDCFWSARPANTAVTVSDEYPRRCSAWVVSAASLSAMFFLAIIKIANLTLARAPPCAPRPDLVTDFLQGPRQLLRLLARPAGELEIYGRQCECLRSEPWPSTGRRSAG